MAYTPTEWKTGDIVTAEKLNKLENGVSNGGDIELVTATNVDDVLTLNVSWNDVYNAITSGKIVVYVETQGDMQEYGILEVRLNYCVHIACATAEMAESETDMYMAGFKQGQVELQFQATNPDDLLVRAKDN